MSRLTILDQIRIASPCEADWNAMAGDDRTRFCGECSKHVYNIAAMTADEATTLILASEGRLCVQIYRRSDGTVLTADCPVGLGRISPGRRVRRMLAVGLVLPALVVVGVRPNLFRKQEIKPFPTGPGVTWDQRVDWALVTLGLRETPRDIRGGLDLRAIFAPLKDPCDTPFGDPYDPDLMPTPPDDFAPQKISQIASSTSE